jgi:hypothetical protein
LGVCPEKKQAVYVQKLGSAPEVYAIDPDTESEKLFLSLTCRSLDLI